MKNKWIILMLFVLCLWPIAIHLTLPQAKPTPSITRPKMKVTLTNEEVKFLTNMILLSEQPSTVPAEFTNDWVAWVTAPVAQHAITPKEAKAILTVVGILTDYDVPIGEIIKKTLETFVDNY